MAWLETWETAKRIPITIDPTTISGGLTENLTNFPVLITLSSGTGQTSFDATGVFDELAISGSSNVNRKRIAVTTTISGVETELYVEIERWDHENEQAYLWTKVPTIASGTNTQLFLYYDKDHVDNDEYVGDTGDAVAQSVWDDDFKLVAHMAQNPSDGANCIKDSTSNTNHGTPQGTWVPGDSVDGKVGKALDFDATGDYLSFSDTEDWYLGTSDFLVCALMYVTDYSINDDNGGNIVGQYVNNDNRWKISIEASGKWRLHVVDNSAHTISISSNSTIPLNEWHLITIRRSGETVEFLLDDAVDATHSNITASIPSLAADLFINNYAHNVSDYFIGQGDEIRFSKGTARSLAWVKATYYNNWDNLLTFGQEQGAVQSPNTNQIIHGNPYYNASSDGVEIYNDEISTEYCIAYIEYDGGINSIALSGENLLMATTNSGIYTLPISTVIGTNIYPPDNLTPYIYQFKDCPDITDNHVKYLHAGGDYLCCVTNAGVDHFNFGTSDSYYRSYTTISGAQKCWQTSSGRFYYIKANSLNAIYTNMCNWISPGYIYNTTGSGNLFFSEACEIKDIAVTEGASIHTTGWGATNNILFLTTTNGVVIIEEFSGVEEDSRYKQYFVGDSTCSGNECNILKGTSDNFVAIASETDSTFDNTKFSCVSFGNGAGLNVVEDDVVKLFWPSTVSGTGNTIRQDCSDLTSVR